LVRIGIGHTQSIGNEQIPNSALGASKVSLSSLSSQELWEKTGRLKGGSEVISIDTLFD
jgi:prolyl-tRNA synthetase